MNVDFFQDDNGVIWFYFANKIFIRESKQQSVLALEAPQIIKSTPLNKETKPKQLNMRSKQYMEDI